MTRFRIGVGLLILLLVLSIAVQLLTEKKQAPVAKALELAAGSAMENNWIAANMHLEEARTLWQKNWHFTAALSDHQPMEDIDGLLSQLTAFAGQKEDYAALCRELSRRVQAMSDAHRFRWWNLL